MEKLLRCAFLLLALGGCSIAESRTALDILMADGAHDVHRVNLEHPAVTQLSYNVEIRYPSVAISVEKIKSLKQQGWHQCSQHKGQWDHFDDSTVKPPRLVHQYLLSFAKDGEYIIIAMRYLSALPSSGASESKPDNSIQRVYIIHYDLSVEEVRRQVGGDAESCLRR